MKEKKYKRKYVLPYIEDKDLFKAVMFAWSMNKKHGYARIYENCEIAADYYHVDKHKVFELLKDAQSKAKKFKNERKRRWEAD